MQIDQVIEIFKTEIENQSGDKIIIDKELAEVILDILIERQQSEITIDESELQAVIDENQLFKVKRSFFEEFIFTQGKVYSRKDIEAAGLSVNELLYDGYLEAL